jgi:hypothetical protein
MLLVHGITQKRWRTSLNFKSIIVQSKTQNENFDGQKFIWHNEKNIQKTF